MNLDRKDLPFQNLLARLNASHEPLEVLVEPAADAKELFCFQNVQKAVDEKGGKVILGWEINREKYLIEAQCHAVWENLNGDLIDITPRSEPIGSIIFVEDENLIYEGKKIDNIRIKIGTNPLADDLIFVSECIFKFSSLRDRATLNDLSGVLNDQQKHFWLYMKGLQSMLTLMLRNSQKRSSQCICGRGKSFEDCHGKDLHVILPQMIK